MGSQLNERDLEESISKLKKSIQMELEVTNAYRNRLSQLQRKDRFIRVTEEPESNEYFEKINPLIHKEIEGLRELIGDQARDSEILRFDRIYDRKRPPIDEACEEDVNWEKHDLSNSIKSLKQDIAKVESEITELQGFKAKLQEGITYEKAKYRGLNESLLELFSKKRGQIYSEEISPSEMDLYLLIKDSLRYGHSLREEISAQKQPSRAESGLGVLLMDQIGPLLKAMRRYNKRGEKSFLEKLLISLIEAWDMKEDFLEKEKKTYKILGQRWIVLSKFLDEENVVFECTLPSSSVNEMIEIECRQPNQDRFLHYPIHGSRGKTRML